MWSKYLYVKINCVVFTILSTWGLDDFNIKWICWNLFVILNPNVYLKYGTYV